MHLLELVDEHDLQRGLEQRLITIRENPQGTDRIYCYSKMAQATKGAWDNPAVRTLRSVITDRDGEILSRGWPKFFNAGDPYAYIPAPDERVRVEDKFDGFLAQVFRNEWGELQCASKSSFASEQAKWANQFMWENGWDIDLDRGQGLLFEGIVDKFRIVLKYPFEGLVLLGGWDERDGFLSAEETAERFDLEDCPIGRPMFEGKFKDIPKEVFQREDKEGVVITSVKGGKLKIKESSYLRLHRIVTGLNPLRVWEAMMERDTTVEELRTNVPDEFLGWVDLQIEKFNSEVAYISEQVEELYESLEKRIGTDPKDRGVWAKALRKNPLESHVWARLDGKPYDRAILYHLRPKGPFNQSILGGDPDQ